jgi:hypothetical protein
MQREPIQFGAMNASRAKRSAAGSVLSHGARKSSRNMSAATVLDEAFADYSRIDAGSSTNELIVTSVPTDRRAATRELIADISTQLKTLDIQRRQLARLLETVSSDATA